MGIQCTLLFALCLSALVTAESLDVEKRGRMSGYPAQCNASVPVTPYPQGYTCNIGGSATDPGPIATTTAATLSSCADTCLLDQNCLSFSYGPKKSCTSYLKPIKNAGFTANPKSTTKWYARNCFNKPCDCPNDDQNPTVCSGKCCYLGYDSNNCGKCGNTCTGGKYCQNGQCACAPGWGFCDGQCVKISNDPNNCGRCGKVCPGQSDGNFCNGGKCISCPNTQQLIVNGGFEQSTSSADPWAVSTQNAVSSIVQDPTTAAEGSNYLQFQISGFRPQLAQISQPLTLCLGSTYTVNFTAWVSQCQFSPCSGNYIMCISNSFTGYCSDYQYASATKTQTSYSIHIPYDFVTGFTALLYTRDWHEPTLNFDAVSVTRNP